MRTATLIIALSSIALALASCAEWEGPTTTLDAAQVETLAKATYPADARLGDDLDILVVRDGSTLQLVNRTANPIGPMKLWLNQQWVGNVPGIQIGTGNFVNLQAFINAFGEPYPYGSFLQPDKAVPVVLAELYDPTTKLRHRLLARLSGL